MENLLIYGNGKIAEVLYHFIKEDFNVVAFAVDSAYIGARKIDGKPVVAFDDVEANFSIDAHKMIIAVGYLQMNGIREQKLKKPPKKVSS